MLPERIEVSTDPAPAARADLVLVTVKSIATATAAAEPQFCYAQAGLKVVTISINDIGGSTAHATSFTGDTIFANGFDGS